MKKIYFLIIALLFSSLVQAAAVPAYSGRMNNAVGSIIQVKAGKYGFAANDPRFGATMGAISTAATTVAVGVATGAVATVGWPALLIGAGISAVVSGAVALGIDGLVSWLWPDKDHKNQTQVAGSGMGTGTPKNFSVIPNTYPAILDAYGGGADIWFSSDATYTKARHIKTVQAVCPGDGLPFCNGNSATSSAMDATFSSVYNGPYPGPTGYWGNGYRRIIETTTTSPVSFTVQIVFDFIPPSNNNILLPPAYTPKWQHAGQSINDLPESYMTQPLSDAQLAAIANTLWKNAAQANNPDAIPWRENDPITPADIAKWRADNPNLVPTVGDFASPVTNPGSSTIVIPNPGTQAPPVVVPGTQTAPSTGPITVNVPPIEWGEFEQPELEETPTVQSILDPVFNMWPQWANYSFPSHASECPRPQFVALGHTFTFDHMCQWVEMIRPAVQAAFALIWALMVIFIVMGA